MKVLHFDASKAGRNTLGIYDTTVHKNIPVPNRPFTNDEEWQFYLDNQNTLRVDPQTLNLVNVVPAPVSIAVKREAVLAEFIGQLQAFVDSFTRDVSPQELASWPAKFVAAKAHLSGTPAPSIVAEATIVGEDPDALAAYIVALAEQYMMITGQVTGLRRATRAAVLNAQTTAAVDTALNTGLADLAQIIANYQTQTTNGGS